MDFFNPKPIDLIIYLLSNSVKKNTIILDFFAGSGTTAHAVLELNKEDNGNRQFILCTNNENNICEEITYQRISKVMQGYATPSGKEIEGLGGELKYLKTNFVKKQSTKKPTDEDKRQLTYEVGTMLALKENTFDVVKKAEFYQIFASTEKLTAIYFSENITQLDELVDYLITQAKPIKLYIFSWAKGEYVNEFEEYKNISVADIPDPILDIYKNLGVI